MKSFKKWMNNKEPKCECPCKACSVSKDCKKCTCKKCTCKNCDCKKLALPLLA